jgi:sugar lactone lactonase YvrE
MTLISVEVALPQNEERNLSQPAAASLGTPQGRACRDGSRRLLRASSPGRGRGWIPALAALLLTSAGAWAQNGVFGTPQPVGVLSSAQSVTVTAQAAGTVARVEVLTLGASGLDFSGLPGSSNCQSAVLAAGKTCTESVTFTPTSPGLRMGAVVLLDGNKNLLGTAYLSGTGLGGLGVLVPGNVLTMAGVYKTETSTKDGIPATQANLNEPAGVTLDGAGNMYIADALHNKVRVVAAPVPPATVGIISTYAGTGQADYSGDNGAAVKATLDSPTGVALDGAGNLYIADSNNNVIRKVTAATGIIATVAGNGTAGYTGDSVLATAAELNTPKGITVDGSGNLYIADTSNQRIRRVDAVTGIITTVAGDGDPSGKGDGKGTYTGDGKPAIDAGLSLPYAVAFDLSGNMYIPDSANNVVRMAAEVNGAITASSVISTVAGFYPGTSGSGGDGGPATQAFLWSPSGVIVDPAGNLYIADTQNFRIQKVNAATGIVATLVANNAGNNLAPGGTGPAPAQIYAPIGLFLDGSGDLYFADHLFMLVEQVQSGKAILNFTQTPVQVGDQSAPQLQTVENDGNAGLDLTKFTPDPNAAVDPGATTCSLTAPLNEDADCQIGAEFAPAFDTVFPAGATSEQLDGNIDVYGNTVSNLTDTFDFPLDIELIGIATPVNATTLTLVSNGNLLSPGVYNSNFGTAVTFTATVTSGATAGIPDGNVAFTDTLNGATITLAASVGLNGSGVAVFTTATPLAVGSHLITATFTGSANLNFLPSSAQLTQVVGEVTATGLKSSQSPSAAGGSVVFTATVTTPSGGGVPLDGTVIFTDTPTGGTAAPIGAPQTIGPSGITTVSTATLTTGLHTITATYSGDAANGILGSKGTLTQDVQAPSTISLTSSDNPSVYGELITFTATVPTLGTIPATGPVTINEQGQTAPLATVALSGNPATATFTTSSLVVGAYVITASHAGDAYYSSSTSPPVNQVVNPVQTTTTLAATPDPGIAGAPVAITATVKPTQGVVAPTGQVSFTDSLNGAAPVSLGAPVALMGGTAAINPTLAPGSHSIVATYSGDADDKTSNGTLPLTVNQAVTTTTLTSSGSPSLVLAPVTFTATVASTGGGVPTGSVAFTDTLNGAAAAPLSCAGTLTAGTATCTTSTLVAGTHTITATYNGDTNDKTSSATFSQVVGTIPTVTDLGASTTGGLTPQVILVAAVLNSAAANAGSLPNPTGEVTFKNGSTAIGSAPLDSSGVATLIPNLPTGTYNIVASYPGDPDHGASSSKSIPISTVASDFNLTVTPDKVTVAATQNVSVNVAVNSTAGFADTIGLGCASLPAGVNCHFSTPSIALPANGVENVTLTIDTNNPLGGGTSAMNVRPAGQAVFLAGLFLPLSVLFGCLLWRFRRRCARSMTTALVLLLGVAALLVTGCSGSFTQSSATPGTYTIQVTGTGAKSNITHYENVTLTINAK